MNSESVPNRCPQCGGTVPPDAPQGLCPRCVLARAATPTEGGAKSGSRLTPPPMETVAAAFPQFEILELIGIGGMGVVYKARQPKLDRVVALKLLPQSHGADPAFAERFHREARFLARLTHPHIVSVFDFGESGGFCYLLMEFVDGVNLRQAMQAGRFSPTQALAIVPDICSALQYAHEQGVLHRDIKPENILLDAQGRVKIADFGIAKLLGDPGDSLTGLTLTQSGARLGTPHYMAPEQIEKPSEVDHRADIYSLGVVFYELLTGELPLGRFAAPSAKTPLDARVDEIVMRALAKERELRQQSAGEMRTQVETVAANPGGSLEAARPSAGSGLLKVGISTITTPERLATFAGQFFLFRTQGQLMLDARQLTHSRTGVTTVIPLAAIRDLSIGNYPRAMNPVGIDFLSVSYEEGGGIKRVFLSPMNSFFGRPSSFNQHVAEWFHAIQDAVRDVTGRAPGTTPAEKLGTPRGSKAIYGLYLAMVLAIAIGVGFVVFVSFTLHRGPTDGPISPFLSTWLGPIVASVAGILFGLRAAFKSVYRAPGVFMAAGKSNPWPHRLKWLLIALFALPLSAFVASLVAPMLHRGRLGGLGGITAGLVPMTTGAVLAWLFLRSRPSGTRPDGKYLQARRLWLGLALVFTVFLTVMLPLVIYLRQREAMSPPMLPTADSYDAQLIRTERFATNAQLRLRWELYSTKPTVVRIGCQNVVRYIELPEVGPSRYGTTVTVLMGAQGTNRASLTVACGIGVTDETVNVFRDGNPEELVAKANEYVTGDLPLKFNTPIWLAFFGSDQVTLELRAKGPAVQAASPTLPSPQTRTPTFSKGDARIDAMELQFAQNRLAELKKQAEVGMVAPQGREVLDAEVAVAEAEGKLRGDPRVAAIVRLKRAAILFSSARKLEAVGSAPHADVEQARLEQMKVRAAFAETLGRDTTTPAELKWLQAWNPYLEEKAKLKAGETSPAQFILVFRDLNVAEAELLHQPLWAAQVRVEYRQEMLEIKRHELSAGQVFQAEVDSAELLLKQAEDERREVEKANPPAAAVPPAENGKTKPILGQDGKFSWLPGQPLLSTDAGQSKGDSAQRAASPEPAKAPVDYSGVVRFFGDVSGKIELLAGHPTWLSEAVLDLHPSQFADLRKVTVQRADGTSAVVDVHRVINDNHREQDLELRDGDRVKVPQRIL